MKEEELISAYRNSRGFRTPAGTVKCAVESCPVVIPKPRRLCRFHLTPTLKS